MSEWIGGRRPVLETLAAGRPARRLLVAQTVRHSPELDAAVADARRAGLPIEQVSAEQLTRLSRFDGHQGLLLEVSERRYADLDAILARAIAGRHDPLILVLEHLQDPTNFGTLLRAAEAAGADGVVFPERGAAPLSPAAVKASAGASEHLLLARVANLGSVLADLHARNVRLVAGDQQASQDAWSADLGGPIAVLVGSEGSGLSGATRRRCDLLVRFPMAGRIGSLNAATAGALLLFEIVRQRSGR